MSANYKKISEQGITQSSIKTAFECPKKARLKLSGIKKKDRAFGAALYFGNFFHNFYEDLGKVVKEESVTLDKARDIMFKSLSDTFESANFEAQDNEKALTNIKTAFLKASGVCLAYLEIFYESEFSDRAPVQFLFLEKSFKLSVEQMEGLFDFPYLGMMDGGIFDFPSRANGLLEHKTKSAMSIDSIEKFFERDIQVNMYCQAFKALYGEYPAFVLYNLIKNPMIRQKKTESDEDFSTRCYETAMEKRDEFFVKLRAEVDPEAVKRNIRKSNWAANMIADCEQYEEDELFENTANCKSMYGDCEYLDYCDGCKDGYDTDQKVNEELSI